MIVSKRFILTAMCTFSSIALCAPTGKKPPLTDPILKIIDGKAGVFDKTRVQNTLWLIKEIKNIHTGTIKLNSQGKPDPKKGKPTDLTFRGKKQTIKSLIALEKQVPSFSPQEKKEIQELFLLVKEYFSKVTDLLLVDARGTQQFMMKLINEFCRKNNRNNSLLKNWNEDGKEKESYAHNIVNFTVFYVFSTDLQNFLAALIVSCPKAYAQTKAAFGAKQSKQQS